jgi:hypothetical protein
MEFIDAIVLFFVRSIARTTPIDKAKIGSPGITNNFEIRLCPPLSIIEINDFNAISKSGTTIGRNDKNAEGRLF